MTMPRMLELLRAGDRGVARALGDAGRAVGVALTYTVNLLNPSLVIIGGELSEAGDVLLDPIRAAIEQSAVPPAAAAVRVTAAELGTRAEVLGAASIQLARAPQALAERLARMSPPDFGPFYPRHEAAVLRFFMERVRSPELACDLTAETFAVALAETFDPSRASEASWVLSLANAQLLRAYRVGEVDDTARERLRIAPLALDDRTLDRVWQLRGEDRNEERKPRLSGQVMVGEPRASRRRAARAPPRAAASWLPTTRPARRVRSCSRIARRLRARGRRDGARRRRRARRRGSPPTRRAAQAAAVRDRRASGRCARHGHGVVGEAVIPDRPAATPGTWLPYATERARGEFPRSWYMRPTGDDLHDVRDRLPARAAARSRRWGRPTRWYRSSAGGRARRPKRVCGARGCRAGHCATGCGR